MSLSQAPVFEGMIFVLLITKWLSLLQVLAQSALILIGGKLKASSDEVKKKKPGKQVSFFIVSLRIVSDSATS